MTAEDQAAIISLMRKKLASSRAAVTALGDGDAQRDALYALLEAEKAINALEKNAARLLVAPRSATTIGTGADGWLKDAREVEHEIDSLPADAQQGTIEDVLRQTAKATVTDTAQLAGKAVDAVGGAVGFGVGAIWDALPLWAKGLLVIAGVGAAGFAGWQVYQLATAPRRVAGALGAV